MKKYLFKNVAILGLGLMGGSLALEIKKRRLASRVVGYNRSGMGRRIASRRKACDRIFATPIQAVQEADLVVLAAPVSVIPRLAKQIAGHLKEGALVTDVGSSKRLLVNKLKKILPGSVHWVAGHPIAGTEMSGMEAAHLGLFQDRWWLLTPSGRGKEYTRAVNKLGKFIEKLGAKVALFTPEKHDRALALISHLPHMVAYALVDTALGVEKGKDLKFSAGGFRDFTRIAGSSPKMWADICLDNQKEILRVISRFERSLNKIKRLIGKRDASGLIRFFGASEQLRRKL